MGPFDGFKYNLNVQPVIPVSLGKKYGKTYTFNEVKYDLIEFMVKLEDETFFQELRTQVVDRLLNGIPEES